MPIQVGILASHVPTIGVLKPGVVTVTDAEGISPIVHYCFLSINIAGKQVRLFVSSGTLSMNIDGTCQVLAEEAVNVEDIDENVRLIPY